MQAKSGGSDRAAIQAGYVYIRATSAGRQTVSHSRILLHPLSLSLCRGKERERERKEFFIVDAGCAGIAFDRQNALEMFEFATPR